MAVEEIRIIRCKLKNSAFDGVEFTEHSDEYLVWPRAVEFAAAQGDGFILHSAREAAAFGIEADGEHDADLYQATRTTFLGFKVGDKFYGAIDDTVDPEKNIVLARAQEGFESHSNDGKYLLPVTDALVRGALQRAEQTGRIAEATETCPLKLKTESVEGKSEYGQNDWNKAIFLDFAEPRAEMLNKRGYETSHVWPLTSKKLEEIGVDGNYVEVRPVGLGVVDGVNVRPVRRRWSILRGTQCARNFHRKQRSHY
ncbi:MAG: hypothetical protein KAT43_03760 [Nanoarchaeota archaeon]|nr:hypothetical protein [Nanoarchaeota archaeon]